MAFGGAWNGPGCLEKNDSGRSPSSMHMYLYVFTRR